MEILAQYGFNISDIVVIAVIIICMIIGRNIGVLRMAFKIMYSVASFGASFMFFPVVSGYLRQTPLFDYTKRQISLSLGLDNAIQAYTKQQEAGLINSLRLPQPIKDKLLENNNSVIYDIVDASGISDYIAGFLANMLINVLLVGLLFTVFMFVLRLLFKSLYAFDKAPVIGNLSHIGGAVAGFFFAVILIWLCFAVIYAFISKPVMFSLYSYINSSRLAVWFYDNNVLLYMILKRMF